MTEVAPEQNKDAPFFKPIDLRTDPIDPHLGAFKEHPDQQLSFINRYLGDVSVTTNNNGLPSRSTVLSGSDLQILFGTSDQDEILASPKLPEVFIKLRNVLAQKTPNQLRQDGVIDLSILE